jgi:glycosyltransferase involved in cell wall biosynthesis
MKVLFLTNIPSPYRVDFFNELGKQCDLTVVFERSSASDRNKLWNSDKITNFKSIMLKSIKIGTDASLSFEVIKYLKDASFDHIIFGVYHTPTAMLGMEYLSLKKRQFILSSDGGFIKEDSILKFKMKTHFISKASAYFSSGKMTSDYLQYYGALGKKIYSYPFTSIRSEDILQEPVSQMQRACIKEKLGINEEKVIISVGQFIYRKGYDILLNACRDIDSKIGVYIIGGEPTEEYLKLKKDYVLEHVHFVGFKKKEELQEFYDIADLFVLPTREDIWGLVVNEAMAYGIPVITTNMCIAGLELIENEVNGYIVPVEESNYLSKTILEFFQNSNNIRKMQNNCLLKIRKYTIDKMASRHIEVLNEITALGRRC